MLRMKFYIFSLFAKTITIFIYFVSLKTATAYDVSAFNLLEVFGIKKTQQKKMPSINGENNIPGTLEELTKCLEDSIFKNEEFDYFSMGLLDEDGRVLNTIFRPLKHVESVLKLYKEKNITDVIDESEMNDFIVFRNANFVYRKDEICSQNLLNAFKNMIITSLKHFGNFMKETKGFPETPECETCYTTLGEFKYLNMIICMAEFEYSTVIFIIEEITIDICKTVLNTFLQNSERPQTIIFSSRNSFKSEKKLSEFVDLVCKEHFHDMVLIISVAMFPIDGNEPISKIFGDRNTLYMNFFNGKNMKDNMLPLGFEDLSISLMFAKK